MIFKEMSINDVHQIAGLYLHLADHIREETGDEYLNYDVILADDIEKWLISSLNEREKKVFVAVDEGKIVGFIAGEVISCFLPISQVDKVGYITGTYVIPSYRRKGILKQLEQIMQEFFKELGLKYIELYVLSSNITGKSSWERMGYSTFREQMRKKLI